MSTVYQLKRKKEKKKPAGQLEIQFWYGNKDRKHIQLGDLNQSFPLKWANFSSHTHKCLKNAVTTVWSCLQGSPERTETTPKPKIKLSQVSQEKGSAKYWQDERHELLILIPSFELELGGQWYLPNYGKGGESGREKQNNKSAFKVIL